MRAFVEAFSNPWVFAAYFVCVALLFYSLGNIFRAKEMTKRQARIVTTRVVCAANRYPDGRIFLGVRHFDTLMHARLEEWMPSEIDRKWLPKPEQGFIDSHGNFLTRHEAWVIAETAGQIVRRVGGDGLTGRGLFSENLY